jgi:hypothetical protein
MAEAVRGRRLVPTGDPCNQALAARLRMRKAEIGSRMTFPLLAAVTGIPLQQVKFSLNDLRRMHVGEFMLIAEALGLDPGKEVAAVQAHMARRGVQHVHAEPVPGSDDAQIAAQARAAVGSPAVK